MRILTCIAWLVAACRPSPAGEPLHGSAPAVATVSWMRELATGTGPLERVIDPTRGLLIVHYEDYDAYDHPVHSAHRSCDPELGAQLPQIRQDLAGALDHMACHDSPAPVCMDPGEENRPQTTYYFVRARDGLRLDAISFVSWNGSSDEFKRQASAFVDRARAQPARCRRPAAP